MSDELRDRMEKMLGELQELQLRARTLLQEVQTNMVRLDVPDMVDSGFCARECAKVCDDLRKGFELRQGLIARSLGVMAGAHALQTGDELTMEGSLATAKPDVNQAPNIPELGTEDYRLLMEWIGVPAGMINNPMLRPSFSGLREELTRRMANGEKLPPGVSVSFTNVSVVFRTKARRKRNHDSQETEF